MGPGVGHAACLRELCNKGASKRTAAGSQSPASLAKPSQVTRQRRAALPTHTPTHPHTHTLSADETAEEEAEGEEEEEEEEEEEDGQGYQTDEGEARGCARGWGGRLGFAGAAARVAVYIPSCGLPPKTSLHACCLPPSTPDLIGASSLLLLQAIRLRTGRREAALPLRQIRARRRDKAGHGVPAPSLISSSPLHAPPPPPPTPSPPPPPWRSVV